MAGLEWAEGEAGAPVQRLSLFMYQPCQARVRGMRLPNHWFKMPISYAVANVGI